MPTCAVCENVQAAGEACDVCGRPFPAGEGIPVPVEAMPDLEQTLLPPVAPPPDPTPDLEPTAIDPVEVVVATMDGLQPTEAEGIPDDPPTAVGPVVACRYCHQPAPADEAFCPHCGMRLPSAPVARAPGAPPEIRLCSDCSVPVRDGSCPSCGARVAT